LSGAGKGYKQTAKTCSTDIQQERCKFLSARTGTNSQNSLQEGISMKKFKLITAIAIVISAATMLCLAKTMGAQEAESQIITVTITPNANPHMPPSVDPESADVYKDKDQQVEWTCSTGCDFTVSFPKSHGKPFSGGTFNKANPKSGVPTGPPGAYPYMVKVGSGSTDPMIIVH
jgi:hypothetical protein